MSEGTISGSLEDLIIRLETKRADEAERIVRESKDRMRMEARIEAEKLFREAEAETETELRKNLKEFGLSPYEILKIRAHHQDVLPIARQALKYSLAKLAENNIYRLAKILGVGRATVYRSFRELGIPYLDRGTKEYGGEEQDPKKVEKILSIYYNTNSARGILEAAYTTAIEKSRGNLREISRKTGLKSALMYRDAKYLGINFEKERQKLEEYRIE